MRLISKTSPLLVVSLNLISGMYDPAFADSPRSAWGRHSANQDTPSVINRSIPLQAQSLPFSPFRDEHRNFEEDFQDCYTENSRRDRKECFKDLRRDQADSREAIEADLQDCFDEDDRDDRQDCLEDLQDDERNSWNRSRSGWSPISPPRPTSRNRDFW